MIRISQHESSAVGITGIGTYLPEKILTNAMLSDKVTPDDDWIFSRTGIKERRIAGSIKRRES